MYDFDNVEENKSEERAPRKIVSPSVGVFTIDEAEVKENVNKKKYLSVKFVNPEGQYFKPNFYLTEKALIRVKELAASTGNPLGNGETDDTIVAKLLGKKVGLVVDGEKVFADIDGRQVIVTQPVLRFNGFSYDPKGQNPFTNIDIRINDKTAGQQPVATEAPKVDIEDLPF